jgi:hypothetical protein
LLKQAAPLCCTLAQRNRHDFRSVLDSDRHRSEEEEAPRFRKREPQFPQSSENGFRTPFFPFSLLKASNLNAVVTLLEQ